MDLPGQVLRELRAFGRALATSVRDSLPDSTAGPDVITGDTLVARFAEVTDSAGSTTSELRHIVATGDARALMHLNEGSGVEQGCMSRNYSRGQRIDVALLGDRVDKVLVTGRADGVHLECLAAKPVTDSTAADSAATRPAAPPAAPRRPPS
jgi:hypothetical protein